MEIESREDGISLKLSPDEFTILHSLVLGASKLFKKYAEPREENDRANLLSDPVFLRLFPNAYERSDDAAEFRELTESSLIENKQKDFSVLQKALGHPGGVVKIVPETVESWVRSLTAMRLIILTRSNSASSDDWDNSVSVSNWLAALTELILELEHFKTDH